MRADRLLSILLLLQARGRMTAGELARQLEVSRRTVCRDLDALSGAGVPVVTDRGPNGGASLLEGYRTDLTGLTAAELEALLAFGGQGPAADLGLGTEIDRAARKLTVAAGSRATGRLRDRILIDGDRWFRSSPVPAHLARVQDALWLDRRVRLRYRRALDRVVDRLVDPYGLVCKSGTWYLLAGVGGQPRVYRVSRIEGAELSEEAFERPPGFDLRWAWAAQVGDFRGGTPEHLSVLVRVAADVSDRFSRVAGDQIVERRGEGIAVLEVPGWWAAVGLLAMFGATVEVLEPEDLRLRMAGIGRELAGLYGSAPRP
ncbi:MAG TPA: WYL domain-containing protein [Candidatus Dormibacteraeota bacterium]|jgi:predicted DNA-binding transcriptional regulator YafY|nr:WYL domain-containing protein [Candidatus Dormibacteraeota bacterium]